MDKSEAGYFLVDECEGDELAEYLGNGMQIRKAQGIAARSLEGVESEANYRGQMSKPFKLTIVPPEDDLAVKTVEVLALNLKYYTPL